MKVIFKKCAALILFVMLLILPVSVHAYRERPDDIIEKSCGDNNTNTGLILVAYDTHHGATSTIAEKIGNVLCEKGFQVDLLMARNVKDISNYDAVVVGSPIYSPFYRCLPGTMNFLETYRKQLSSMPVFYFVVCAYLREDIEEIRRKVKRIWIDPLFESFSEIEPIDIGAFAGKIQFSELYPIESILMEIMGYPEGDWRNFEKVGTWAENVANTLQ